MQKTDRFLLGFVLGGRMREGRDLMGPPGQGPGIPTIKPPYVRGPAPASQSTPDQSSSAAISPDSMSAVAAALRNGNKIEAIKLYRAATGADLKASKDAVEAMEG